MSTSSRRNSLKGSRLVRWWNSQNTAIKAALVTGILTVFAAVCSSTMTSVGSLLSLGQLFNQYFAADPKMEIVYSSIYKGAQVTELNDYELEVLFEQCWQAETDWTIQAQPKDNSVILLNFLMSVNRRYLIKDISLIVDEYKPPPDVTGLDVIFKRPTGGAGRVNEYELGNITIGLNEQRYSLTRGELFEVGFEEPLNFAVFIALSQPGIYRFYLEAKTEDSRGNEVLLRSSTLSHGFVVVGDASTVNAFMEGRSQMISLIECDH